MKRLPKTQSTKENQAESEPAKLLFFNRPHPFLALATSHVMLFTSMGSDPSVQPVMLSFGRVFRFALSRNDARKTVFVVSCNRSFRFKFDSPIAPSASDGCRQVHS
jgi:hypothetical protein